MDYVEIKRLDGDLNSDVFRPLRLGTLAEADGPLQQMARTAPGHTEGYHTVAVEIVWADGLRWSTRCLIVRDRKSPSLAVTVGQELRWLAFSRPRKTTQAAETARKVLQGGYEIR